MLRMVFCCLVYVVGTSLANAQTIPVPTLPTESVSNATLQSMITCSCPRHSGSTLTADPMQQLQTGRKLGVAGVRLLDELPKGAVVVAELMLESPASADSSENYGYKRFYALLQLKAQAAIHGANAISDFKQLLNEEKNKIIFSAKAVKVEP
jgi:hypothetical protein